MVVVVGSVVVDSAEFNENGLAVVPMVPFVVTIMGFGLVTTKGCSSSVVVGSDLDFLWGFLNVRRLDLTLGLDPGALVGNLGTALDTGSIVFETVEEI